MRVLLVEGTCLKFGAVNVVLTGDTELEFPTVHNHQQLAETLFGANLAKVDENLARLEHTEEEIREVNNPFDITGRKKRERVIYKVNYGANGVANREEIDVKSMDNEL